MLTVNEDGCHKCEDIFGGTEAIAPDPCLVEECIVAIYHPVYRSIRIN